MATLKLRQLADRTPVKIALTIMPELHQSLQTYADLYAEAYGKTEAIADLIPAMLTSFLESDRAFTQTRGKSS